MTKFALTFRQRKDYSPVADEGAAWMTWFRSIGPSIVDIGAQAVETTSLGDTGGETKLAGYTVISAVDIESAVALAQGCPALSVGGGVEVGALVEVGAQPTPGGQS